MKLIGQMLQRIAGSDIISTVKETSNAEPVMVKEEPLVQLASVFVTEEMQERRVVRDLRME